MPTVHDAASWDVGTDGPLVVDQGVAVWCWLVSSGWHGTVRYGQGRCVAVEELASIVEKHHHGAARPFSATTIISFHIISINTCHHASRAC